MQHLLPWIALKQIPGIGNHLYKRLLEHFETPERVFGAQLSDLQAIEGLGAKIARAILAFKGWDQARAEMALAEKAGCKLVTLNDSQYPPLLREIHDPPPFLYVNGTLGDTRTGIAVVGSRSASQYGISMARRLGYDLAASGMVIVSGLARGVDSAAHQAAIDAGGRTIAVLGNGLSTIYPPENRALFTRIAENGAVVTEFPIRELPNAYNFPARNRIISGMTLGTVVVEAARKSGSLITAQLAAEQGREVFAVPGSANSLKSTGAHNLLKQGAKLVTCAADVLEEFPRFFATEKKEAPLNKNILQPQNPGLSYLGTEEAAIANLLEAYPIHIDDLCRQLEMDVARVSAILLNLELKGLIAQLPGKYFCTKEDNRE